MSNEQVTAIVSIIGALTVLTPLLSLLIAWLTYRRNVKKDQAARANHEGELSADIKYIKRSVDELKDHDEKEAAARQQMAIDLVRIETKLDSHISNKSIHSYAKKVVTTKGGHK